MVGRGPNLDKGRKLRGSTKQVGLVKTEPKGVTNKGEGRIMRGAILIGEEKESQ